MKTIFVKRGWIALLACCTAAMTSAAMAQTDFYLSGGTANWYLGNSIWYSGINTAANPRTVTGAASAWDNNPADQSIANIGYVSTSGSGGANATSNYAGTNFPFLGSGTTNNDKGVSIKLDPSNPINAYGVQFSYDSSNGTVEQNSRYSLTGGTLNLGPAGLSIDLHNTQGYTTYGTFGDSVYSDINAAPNGGTLNANVVGPYLQTGSTLYTTSYLYLSGTNSYTTLHVGGAVGSNNGAINEVAIQSPCAAGSCVGSATSGTGTIQNLVLEDESGLEFMGSNSSTLVVNNITLNGPASTKSSAYGAYSTANTTGNMAVAHIGAGDSTAGISQPALILGPINGNGDVVFDTGSGADGLGRITLMSPCNYTGDTFMVQYSTRGPGGNGTEGVPSVTLGCNNALPTSTNLIFGSYQNSGNSGMLDLGGHSQQVGSLASMGVNVGSTQNDYCAGLTNSNSASTGTLNLFNDGTQNNWIESQFHGVIGANYFDTESVYKIATYNNVALHLLANNCASLTLGLANQGSSPPGQPLTESNTYNGGTTVDGGMLFASNGSTYNDGQNHGMTNNGYGLAYNVTVTGVSSLTNQNAPNSATGTGWVMVNSGGTIGGSRLGGAIGMPDAVAYQQGAVGSSSGSLGAGRVTINGGTLLPGGGYFVDASGGGAGGYVANGTNFTPTSGPTFHVLGDLVVNAGSNINFNFDSYNADQIAIGGELATTNASPSNPIQLNLNDEGTMANGLTLFSFNNGSIPSDVTALIPADFKINVVGGNAGWTYSLLENSTSTAMTLEINGASVRTNLTWSGIAANGLWDTATTSNFTLSGSTQTFQANDIVAFDNTGANKTVTIAATGVQPNGMIFTNSGSGNAYTVTGGPIGSGFINVTNGGMVTLSNSGNTYTGNTYLASGSTLQANYATSMGSESYVEIADTSELILNFSSGTLSNQIHFNPGSAGPGSAPTIKVPNGTVVVTGGITSDSIGVNAAGLTKMGNGTLTLTNAAQSDDVGSTYIGQGTIHVTTTNGVAGQSYDALGSGNMYTGYTNAAGYTNAGTLWLDNINVGVNQNNTTGRTLGFFDMYPGGGIKGTGSASLSYQAIAAVLPQPTSGIYSASNVYFTTGTSPTDELTLNNYVQQFDVNSGAGHYFNATTVSGSAGGTTGGTVATATANTQYSSFGMQTTIHVNGSGRVILADGNAKNSDNTYGGAWSVESGELQVGPFQFNPNYNSDATSATYGNAGVWNGPTGEPLNALGFMTPKTTSTSGEAANPDAPTTATIQAGGILAIAIDQINPLDPTLAPGYYLTNFNATPGYLRTSIVLSGGSVASTGYEATFYQESQGTEAAITASNNPVTARFGGNFTVSSNGGSVLTFDPNGQAKDSLGNTITSDNEERTVELVGGYRYLGNASWGYSAGTTLAYATDWDGPLTVASSGSIGGTFNIKRSGGTVNVTPGASITIQPYSTVNISNDNSSTLVVSTSGSTYGQMVPNTALPNNGVLPVENYVLSNGAVATGTAVAIVNNGTFNVNAGTQAVASISGAGLTNVTSTASLFTTGISQSSASVASGATLNLTGPGVAASSLVVANSGSFNVTGGSHTMNGVVSQDAIGNPLGTTTVSGGTLAAANVYQNTLNVNAGGTIQLTTPAGFANNSNVVNNLNLNGGLLDVQNSGLYVANANSSAIYSAIQAGASTGWTASSGITSSTLAKSQSSTYGVGYVPNFEGSGYTLVQTALLGDAFLTGTVNAQDRALVSGTNSNLYKSNVGWSGGDFYYQGYVTPADRAAEISNELAQSSGGPMQPALQVKPQVQVGSTGSALVDYNSVNGVLSLVISGAPDVDSFNVAMQNMTGALAQLEQNNLGSGWQDAPAGYVQALGTYSWAKITSGDQSADLAPGSYVLADLPTGLTSAAFGSGGVTFYNSTGGQFTDSVGVVPEPGTLALLATAGLAALGGYVVRRRRNQGQSRQA